MFTMKIVKFCLAVVPLLVATSSPALHPLSRIDEIAASLPETPRADGVPASDRAKWGPIAASEAGREVVAYAETIAAESVPETPDSLYLEYSKNGNRSNYENALVARNSNFRWLYLGECLEHKGRFIPKIVEYMEAYCAMKSWNLPAHDANLASFKGQPHVDLVSAEISRELAFALSWLGDAIPSGVREKVYSEIDRRTFRPYLDHARGKRKIGMHWWFHGANNWNSVCNSCVVRTALAIIPDRRLRAEFVIHAADSAPYALAGYSNDGYCSEGMGYWNYGYGHFLAMGLSIRNATGGKVDLFADPKTKKIMEYAYGFQLENGKSPHIADGGGSPAQEMPPARRKKLNTAIVNGTLGEQDLDLLALGRQIWPDLVSTAAMESPLFGSTTSYFTLKAFPLRAFGQEPPPCAPTMDVLPPRTWFPDAQVLISRFSDAARKLNLSIAIKGGDNAEFHNHNDIGSYTIMIDGAEMCGDPGGEVYTRRTFSSRRYDSKMLNSYGHPVPVVGGKLQQTGRKAAAKVLKTEFTDGVDTIVLDCTAAYAAPNLKSLVRTMVFDREHGTVTVTDEVSFSNPAAFEVPVVTYRDWTKDEGAMRFKFKHPSGKHAMGLEVKASAPLAFGETVIDNPGRPSPKRLAFKFAEPVTTASVTMVFTPQDAF